MDQACLPASVLPDFRTSGNGCSGGRLAVAKQFRSGLWKYAPRGPQERATSRQGGCALLGGKGISRMGGLPPWCRQRGAGNQAGVEPSRPATVLAAGLVDRCQEHGPCSAAAEWIRRSNPAAHTTKPLGRAERIKINGMSGESRMTMKTCGTNGAPIRVAHVSLGLEMGGMEKLLVEFARLADRERYQLHFVCLEERGKLADEVEGLGWPVDALGKRPGVRPGLVLKLARLFRRLRVDVVHTHNEPGCIYGVPAARLARVALVLNTLHGQGLPGGTRAARLYTCRRAPRRPAGVRLEGRRRLIGSIGPSERRVSTIWNGIDTQKFAFRGPCPAGPAVSSPAWLRSRISMP